MGGEEIVGAVIKPAVIKPAVIKPAYSSVHVASKVTPDNLKPYND